jgi:hypothetical protein
MIRTRTPSFVTVRYVSDWLFSPVTSPGRGSIVLSAAGRPTSNRTFTSPGVPGALTVSLTSLSFSFARTTSSAAASSSLKNTRARTRLPANP